VSKDEVDLPSYLKGAVAERERAAKIAEHEAELIKHTSYTDGLGMGDSRRESTCHRIAAAIRGQDD